MSRALSMAIAALAGALVVSLGHVVFRHDAAESAHARRPGPTTPARVPQESTPEPPTPPKAEAPGKEDAAPRWLALHRETSRKARALLEQLDDMELFDRFYGPVATRPIGTTEREWIRWIESNETAATTFLEPLESALPRFADQNRLRVNPLGAVRFIAFGYREGDANAGSLRLVLGNQAVTGDMSKSYYRTRWAAARGHSWESLPEALQAEFEKAYLARACARERTRAKAWEHMSDIAATNRAQGRSTQAQAFLATHLGVHAIRSGEAPGVDRILREIEAERRKLRRALAELVR